MLTRPVLFSHGPDGGEGSKKERLFRSTDNCLLEVPLDRFVCEVSRRGLRGGLFDLFGRLARFGSARETYLRTGRGPGGDPREMRRDESFIASRTGERALVQFPIGNIL